MKRKANKNRNRLRHCYVRKVVCANKAINIQIRYITKQKSNEKAKRQKAKRTRHRRSAKGQRFLIAYT